ncbi:K02A2.6-like, partial [Cordylochernes scorpioides]
MAHDFGKCPAYGKECYKCRQPNHFANSCKNRAVRCIQEIEEEKDNLLIVDSIMVGQVLRKPWKELIYIQGHPVDIKLDTGADVNILPERLIKEWPNMPLLETADCKIYTYTGQQIPVVGKCQLDCKTKYACRKVTFLIVNNSAVPILGLDECVKLNLVKIVETISDSSVTLTGLLDEYKDVFKGNGHLSYMYDIKISDKAEAKISPARRLPRALLQPVKEELFKMEEDGIIEKIEEPTVWAHPMVVVKKPSGKYRICIDPRELNKWVLREHYTLPAPENILAEIPKAKFYSVLDAKSAFWQVPLSENTSKYLVMSTPFGRYRFLRLPFGISSAPEIFQKIMHKIFCDIPNVVCYIDDLLIWGNSIVCVCEDHNSTLKKVLDLARESRLKLTLNKLQMATGVVKYLGHTISQEGILPDQDKVRVIQNMQIPKNKQEFQRILGTVTYLAKFIPDLSSNTSNMRNLLKKDIIWNWNIAADQELNFIETLLTSPPVLRHFDPNEPLELFADASKDGLGAILMQKEKPLSYASASLTSPQKHYSQIEKELLALYFGCKRFHYFLYGRKFTAYTDHKPLVSLLKKNFDQMSPRLQRLSLYLLNYQFELKFIPGKSMIPADTLSRHFLPQEQMEDKELDLCTQTFVLNVEIKDQRLTRLQEDTLNDKECCLLKQYILTGWPLHKKNLPSNLKPYWEFKEELNEWQNLICRVDYFSKYPEIYQLQDMTTDTIIRRLKRTFSNFGIPETLVSDNGPPFFSKEFQNFTRTWNIVHVTSSPYHAQSNGMVERTVQTLKKLIKRCGEESTDPYLALLNLRNTPHNNLPSPAQILMSRKLRSIIPSKTSQFVPSMINNEAIQKQLVDNQVKMKNYYDRHTRPADPLSINDRVWFRKDKSWIPGQLKNQANEPRSFYVKDQEGNEYRRNSIHIREDKRSETTHTDWEKPLELNQEQADLQDLEETPSQPTSSGQLSSPGSPENVTTTGPPESCTNGSPGNLITTRSGRCSSTAILLDREHDNMAQPTGYSLRSGAKIALKEELGIVEGGKSDSKDQTDTDSMAPMWTIFIKKLRLLQLGLPGASERILITGILHGLPEEMQQRLAVIPFSTTMELRKVLERCRPSIRPLEKHTSKKLENEGWPFPPSERVLYFSYFPPNSMFPVNVNGVKLNAFLDPGSSIDLIRKNTLEKYGWKSYPAKTKLTTINHNSIFASECIDLELEADNRRIEVTAVILEEMPFEIMLGKPTMKNFKIQWDFHSDNIKCLALNANEYAFTINDVQENFPSLCEFSRIRVPKFEVDFLLKPDCNVIRSKPYSTSEYKRKWISNKIKEMLDRGIIVPSTSEFASPCVLVPKKDSSFRLCQDYRRLNRETHLDPFPFPSIDRIIDRFGGCHYFTKIDLRDGFWQIGLTKESRKFSAFVTQEGLYEFTRLPFGWKNSPPKFQRIMTEILGDLLDQRVVVYIDDICCGAPTKEKCAALSYKILTRLAKFNMTINLGKCQFCVPQVELLGRIINGDFKHMRDQVIEKVMNMRRPYNLKSLQCFTGLTGHFRPYIPNYAMIIRPLDALKRKYSIFRWTEECEESYLKLLALITSNPILRIPDCSLQYELSTDASYYGTGAVLFQRDITEKKNRQLRVISYYSYTFTRAEQNYSVTEKECLAVLKAVKHFRAYLECKPFTVHTDHRALTQLLSCGNLRDRLARWQLFLSSFEMNINHRSGKELQDADALSRLAIDSPTDPNESILWTNHRSIDLKLGDNNKYLVPPEDRDSIFQLYHDDPLSGGHSGFLRTYHKLRQRFYWYKMKNDIRSYIASCPVCQQVKFKY